MEVERLMWNPPDGKVFIIYGSELRAIFIKNAKAEGFDDFIERSMLPGRCVFLTDPINRETILRLAEVMPVANVATRSSTTFVRQ